MKLTKKETHERVNKAIENGIHYFVNEDNNGKRWNLYTVTEKKKIEWVHSWNTFTELITHLSEAGYNFERIDFIDLSKY